MENIRAIGFDLFNTLVTVKPQALEEALNRLMRELDRSGLEVDREAFHEAHREAAMQLIRDARRDGKETHNRFWISMALERLGHAVPPEDECIARAVESYFSAFYDFTRLIPDTREILTELKSRYRLGLLSNFTHAPAAVKILTLLGLDPFFETVVISGDFGYRKPHKSVFQKLMDDLQVRNHELVYIGDDPEPDIFGARQAGIRPVWTTYVRDRNIPFAPGIASDQKADPEDEVPRISDWKDLLVLLNGGVKP